MSQTLAADTADAIKLASKQFYCPGDVVTLGHQSQDWGRTGCNPRPSELIRLGENNGHGINDLKGSSIAEYWHARSFPLARISKHFATCCGGS